MHIPFYSPINDILQFCRQIFITRNGGTDIKNFIKRVLQRIFSNELSSKCSWTGFRNNYRLENIWFMSIMKGNLNIFVSKMFSAISHFCLFICSIDLSREKFNSSDLDFELHVKDWFRHGSQRFIRDQQTQNK